MFIHGISGVTESGSDNKTMQLIILHLFYFDA